MFEHVQWILAQDDAPVGAGPEVGGAPAGAQQAPAPAQNGELVEGADGGTADAGGTGGAPPPQSPFGGMGLLLPLILIFAVVLLLSSRGQRKEKKKREQLLASLKKGDKVQTIAGILGSIVEVREDEVIVKVDENTNARMHFRRSAIQGVIEKGEQGKAPDEQVKLEEAAR